MSIYVLAPTNVVQAYPYALTDMIRANPETSFPSPMTDEIAADFSVYPVKEVPQPAYDPLTENLDWIDPRLEDGVWVQQWSVSAATPEQIAQRLEQKRQAMVVTPFEAKAALLDADLLDDIEALMADPLTDRVVVLAWNNVTEFRRLSPMVTGIASALGWTDEQLDGLFEAAALKTA